jgi:predicted AlkP superfamily pyrophosphatase or phosphodiesterase
VDNAFYEPAKDQVYTMGNRAIVQDGYWYGGTPIWVLAEQRGIKAASYFFVGTEAPIQGVRPSYYYDYDGGVPNLTRIAKVFDWLRLPEADRPRLITLYFSDMDDTGHRYGPNNDVELKKTLDRLDHELGALFEGLECFDLPIHVVLVSDHGMMEVKQDNLILLEDLTEGIKGRVVNNGALAHLHLENPKEKEKVIQVLLSRNPNLTIDDLSTTENYSDLTAFPQRKGDLLILPKEGYYLTDVKGKVRYQSNAARFQTQVFGEHGFTPRYKDMRGIFYAKGPQIKAGLEIEPFQNIHIYPLLCRILNLPLPENLDGKSAVLEPILK